MEKYKKTMYVGPANCTKDFCSTHLHLQSSFITFAWVGTEEAEVIFLNDFRWTAQLNPWHNLLLFVEDQAVNLPAPKSHFVKDVLLTNDTPIFYTSGHELTYVKNGVG